MINNELANNEMIDELKEGIIYSDSDIQRKVDDINKKYGDISIRKVCGYGRVSTKHSEQLSSLLTQHEIFCKYCEANENKGYVLVEEIYEQKTGTLKEKRTKFMQMINDAKAGKYNTLLFKDSKRYSRNIEDFLIITDDLKAHGVNVIFINEGLDTFIDGDRDKLAMLGIMSEMYSNSLHKNLSTVINIKFNSELGRVPGDVFGYRRVKGDSSRANIINKEAELIRELFNRYADGEGIASITEDWQNRGIKTYRGGNITMFALRRYIRNPLYKGVLVMNKYTKDSVRAKRKRNSDDELIIRNRPDLQIVDTELWDKCNSIMDLNKRKMYEETNGRVGYRHDILSDKLFAKVIKCGECGRNYNRRISNHKDISKRYIYLMCGYKKYNKKNQANQEVCHNEKVIRLDSIIELITIIFNELILNQDNLRETVHKKVTSIIKQKSSEFIDKSYEEEINNAKAKLKRYAILFKDGEISEDEYNDAKKEVKRLESQIKLTSYSNITDEEIDYITNKFINNIKKIMKEQLVDDGVNVKEFNKLFDNITVYEDHIDIVFRGFNRRLGNINLNEIIDNNNKIKCFVPVVDNNICGCKSLVQKLEPYSIEEKQYLDSIEDRELRNKIRKKLHRKNKTQNRKSDRTSEIIGLSINDVISQHTNQVIKGIKGMSINLYIS